MYTVFKIGTDTIPFRNTHYYHIFFTKIVNGCQLCWVLSGGFYKWLVPIYNLTHSRPEYLIESWRMLRTPIKLGTIIWTSDPYASIVLQSGMITLLYMPKIYMLYSISFIHFTLNVFYQNSEFRVYKIFDGEL